MTILCQTGQYRFKMSMDFLAERCGMKRRTLNYCIGGGLKDAFNLGQEAAVAT